MAGIVGVLPCQRYLKAEPEDLANRPVIDAISTLRDYCPFIEAVVQEYVR